MNTFKLTRGERIKLTLLLVSMVVCSVPLGCLFGFGNLVGAILLHGVWFIGYVVLANLIWECGSHIWGWI